MSPVVCSARFYMILGITSYSQKSFWRLTSLTSLNLRKSIRHIENRVYLSWKWRWRQTQNAVLLSSCLAHSRHLVIDNSPPHLFFFEEETKGCPKLHSYWEAGLGGCGETASVFVAGTAALENSLAVSLKVQHNFTIWSSSLTPRYIPKESENICLHRGLTYECS